MRPRARNDRGRLPKQTYPRGWTPKPTELVPPFLADSDRLLVADSCRPRSRTESRPAPAAAPARRWAGRSSSSWLPFRSFSVPFHPDQFTQLNRLNTSADSCARVVPIVKLRERRKSTVLYMLSQPPSVVLHTLPVRPVVRRQARVVQVAAIRDRERMRRREDADARELESPRQRRDAREHHAMPLVARRRLHGVLRRVRVPAEPLELCVVVAERVGDARARRAQRVRRAIPRQAAGQRTEPRFAEIIPHRDVAEVRVDLAARSSTE